MSVDKFGRFSERKREGLKLSPDGNYDMQKKRIKFLHDPIDPEDAINLMTLKANTLPINSARINAQGRRIVNVARPTSANDVVTKGFLENSVPLKTNQTKSYSVHQYSIQDLAYPQSNGDAVNLKYVKDNCLLNDVEINAKSKIITNLKSPVKPSDAVNLGYMKANTVNLKYVKDNCILNDVEIDAKSKIITNLQQPFKPSDAVNLEYMKANTLIKNQNTYNAQKCLISNILSPVKIDDAVSKRYLKEVLGDLGYTIYSRISTKSGRASLHDSDDWKSKALDFSWEDLFKL